MKSLLVAASGLAVVAALASTPALAQAEPQRAEAPEAVAEEPEITDIVVTAERREASLSRTGTALAVVTGETLVQSGVSQAGQLSALVPALSASNVGGANAIFFVRGVGNFTVNGYSDPAIAFNYDGVYVGRPTSTSGVFYDLERIEVLKGPQGTLYGRNATAGAINVLPTRPKLGESSGYVTAGYGNYDAFSVQGAINLPIGEDGAIRVSGNVIDRGAYMSDGTSDEKTQAFRIQMRTDLTPDLSLRVGADYSHSGGRGMGATYLLAYAYNPATQTFTPRPSNFDLSSGMFDAQSQAFRQTLFAGGAGRTLGVLDDGTYNDNTFFGVNATVELKTGAGTITFIPAWRYSDLDNISANNGGRNWIQEKDEQTSLELRFNSDRIGMFDFILGGYFFNETVKGNYSFNATPLQAFQDFTNTTKSWAAFGRATAHLSDSLRLIGGIRYSSDEKQFEGQVNAFVIRCLTIVAGRPSCPTVPLFPTVDSPGLLPAPFFVPPAGGAGPIVVGGVPTGAILINAQTNVNSPLSNSRTNFRAAVEYDVAPGTLAYASFETGYRSGGFALAFGHETYNPEYIDAYTIGLKSRLLDNRLQLNVEGFLWKYRDQQVSHSGLDARGNNAFFTENIGRSTIQGFEVDAKALVTPTTLLSANIQYIDSNADSFTYVVPVGAAPPYTGCGVSVNPANAAQHLVNCSGLPAYNSPKWTINLAAEQTFNIGDFKLVGTIDTQYKSRRWVSFEYIVEQPASWTTNAQISFGPQSDKWSIAAFVRNIENDRLITFAPSFAGGVSAFMGMSTPPRTYGVRATVKF